MYGARSFHIALPISLLAAIVWASSLGPVDSVTGAPGEGNCTNCHNGFALNDPAGTFSIVSNKATYIAGDTLALTVSISHPSQSRWGFESTVLDTATNSPKGTLLASDAVNTQKSTVPGGLLAGRQYIKHTQTGTYAGTASGQWSFKWVAPNPTAGTVRFYASGNAANNDGTFGGDYIYTASLSIPVGACCVKEGDCNHNGSVNVIDVTYLVNYLFKGGPVAPCKEEADVNDNGSVNVIDITHLVGYLFKGGPLSACP